MFINQSCLVLVHRLNHQELGQLKRTVNNNWYVNSGCSRHMTGNIQLLEDVKKIDGGYVAFAGSNGRYIIGQGTLKNEKLKFEKVNYVGFSWVKFLAMKEETIETVHFLILGLENLCKQKVSRIRSDNGTEFKNSKMGFFSLQKGIHNEFSARYVPQQNGVAERKDTTLVEAARTMLSDSKLPVTFWAVDVSTNCHVHNRVLAVKRHNKTCYELLNNRKPNLDYLLPFGNSCTLLKTRNVSTKFSEKAIEGVFLGYVANSLNKRVYNKETRQVEELFHIDCSNRSVTQKEVGPEWAFDYDSLFKSFNFAPDLSAVPSDPNVASCSGTHETDNDEDDSIFQDSLTDPLIIDDDSSTSTQDESTQLNVLPVPEVASIKELKDHPMQNIIGNLQNGVKTRSLLENTCLYSHIRDTGVLDEELAQFDKLKVWNLVDLPKGFYPIGTKWVFQCKKDDRAVVVRNKARLVVQGVNQQECIDYTEVYAPVVRLEEIQLFLAFASFKGFKVYQLDVKSVNLYGKVKEEVYVLTF
ncbi:hypothetical protein L1987_13521 [Smallanthus sonchifolius]|uniref:Uncharacterized protein n=1 Tax=Smallanthus sonchifolius TaxID=185202 RepID=A0ACB9JH68_9ASTR|nr:hypothetical protein L1987_13521 [Smallanthus sonchifolius]